ncbi:unnamed protein product [Cladocopium goreaui]|uniref:Uncharacterized protein n=1 Tax=Cladocopium goreaui TaxID=2562237 RepID=A0A9P1FP80_9DINO|nr:unnamed protein product [Cladocopium goreaui]
MDQDLQKFIAKVKDDPMMPIGTKWLQLQKKLQENGLMYQQTLKPTQLLEQTEIMASMASDYAHTKGLKKALQLAQSTKPKCMPYIAAIGHYVQKNNGGTSFDTIHVLAHVSNAFTNTLTIGEDFMTTIAFMDFKEKSTTFPWFLVRSTLYVTKKQHKSRDDIQFEILGEISSNFSQELHDLLNGTNAGAPTSSSTAEQEESHDAKLIAKRKWGMEENQFYHQKGDLNTVAKFEHMPLFPTKDGQPWKMEVEFEELKNVKKAATKPPQLLLNQAMQDLLPESLGTFHQDKLKAEATIAMTQLYHENLLPEGSVAAAERCFGGNMEVHMTKAENGFQVPILRNNSKVEPGTFLTMLCSEDEMAITRMWSISWNGYATTIPEDLLKEYQELKTKRDDALTKSLMPTPDEEGLGNENAKKQKPATQTMDMVVQIDVGGTMVHCLCPKSRGTNNELMVEMDMCQLNGIFQHLQPDTQEITLQSPKKIKKRKRDQVPPKGHGAAPEG